MGEAQRHLVPWKKGQSGNPGGRPKLPEHLKFIRSISSAEVAKIISKYACMTYDDLKASLNDPLQTVLEKAVAKVFQKAIKEADYTALNFLLDRAVGKAPIMQDEDDDSEEAKLNRMSFQDLLQLVRQTIPALQEKVPELATCQTGGNRL